MKHKLYLVVFTLTESNKRVYKIGLHRGSNVYNRFKRELKEGIIKDFKIWISVWVNNNILEQVEKECFNEIVKVFGGYKGRFHNFWLPKMINGLTEMRKYNDKEVRYAYKMLERKGDKYLEKQDRVRIFTR
tara:strand:- start:7 stop:399 length:393 start_codon:yes stop_codon:yes gene_type:complete